MSPQQILTTVMTNVVVDKSADNGKHNLRPGVFFSFFFFGMRCREGGYDRRLW